MDVKYQGHLTVFLGSEQKPGRAATSLHPHTNCTSLNTIDHSQIFPSMFLNTESKSEF